MIISAHDCRSYISPIPVVSHELVLIFIILLKSLRRVVTLVLVVSVASEARDPLTQGAIVLILKVGVLLVGVGLEVHLAVGKLSINRYECH